jgi:hypothetical protein
MDMTPQRLFACFRKRRGCPPPAAPEACRPNRTTDRRETRTVVRGRATHRLLVRPRQGNGPWWLR